MAGAPIVFFDIAGPDLPAQRGFYEAVFGWAAGADGRLQAPVQGPLHGMLRTDPAEKMLYIGVPDVSAALALVQAHGGRIEAHRFEVPGVVILGLFRDPAGNRMGLVEMDGERPRVP